MLAIGILGDLMDVTRITRGKIQLRRRLVDLATLVRRTLEDQRTGFDAANVRLDTDLEAGAFWIDGDADRLVQTVGNLLFTDYALPFEIIGFLLLAAIIGAIFLARRPEEDERAN